MTEKEYEKKEQKGLHKIAISIVLIGVLCIILSAVGNYLT